MESLPAEILEKIFRFLDLKSLELLEPTCQRWSDIIALRFYQTALAARPPAVRRQLTSCGWKPAGPNAPGLVRQLYRQVFYELERRWRGLAGSSQSPVGPEILLGEYEVGNEVILSKRVSAICAYQEKIYLGIEGSLVEVRQLPSFGLLTTLSHDSVVPQHEAARKNCQMCLHGRTLAVLGPNRDKCRLFDTETDQLVGEIETRLGPVYHVAISSNLLVLLSGWSILYWSIDSDRPHMVRGQYKGVVTDFMGEPEFQNWLESHEVMLNSRWVVTTATRTREPEGNDGGVSVCRFLHVRRVGADGHIGSLIRPARSQLPPTLVEILGTCLSSGDLLAMSWILAGQERVMLSVLDLSSGNTLQEIASNHLLASIMVPLHWEDNKIFVKIIPQPDASSEYCISVGWYNLDSGERVEVPGVLLESTQDLLYLDSVRLVRVATRLTLSSKEHIDYDMDEEIYAEIERLSSPGLASARPKFVVKGRLYNFWPTW